MLTNLASYLMGYLEPTAAPADSAEARLSPPLTPERDVPAHRPSLPESDDEDWLLVEAAGIENDENARVVRLSRSASASSLASPGGAPGVGMEESWFVTPPPCFTRAPPAGLDPSPLETLLIEHPSMSVYHPRPLPRRVERSRSASPPHGATVPAGPTATAPLPARQPLAAVNEQQGLRCLELKAAAKYQKKQSLQVNRNQLERSNKAREVNSRSRRQRRSDRQLQHSGANNNRKCC